MESITEFIKIFCEKVWFWLIVSVFTLLALCSEEIFSWLGFEKNNRWMVGIIAILALSLSIQHICDWVKEYRSRRSIIKNIDYLTDSALKELKNIVNNRKKTLKLKDKDNIEQKRIVNHFNLERNDDYVTFPDFLWKELEKRFVKETDKHHIICNTNNKNWAKKIFCNKITWIVIAICVLTINPKAIITQYISDDWYLWLLLIFAAFLVWVIFKASHGCKRTSTEDIASMGLLYCFALFICFASPMSNSYSENTVKRILDCLTVFGPLIVGIAAVFFACTQWKVAAKQHNLALLEKRLSLKNKFENYVNNKLKESLEPKLNPEALRDTFSDLTNISGDAYLLFSKDISENIMQLAQKFEKLKTSIHYKKDKDQGKSLSFYKVIEGDFEKDISKVYGEISHESAVLVNEMHLIMREGKI